MAVRVGQAPAPERPDDPGAEHDGQGRACRRGGLLVDVDPVKRDEGVQPVKDDGAEDHDPRDDGKGAPPVPLLLARPGSGDGLCRCMPAARARELNGQEGRHEDKRDGQEGGSPEAPRRDDGSRHDRTQRDAHLAPHGKDAHARGLPVAGVVVHQTGTFGVEGRNADAAQDNHRDGKPVIGQQGAEGHAAARHGNPRRDEPGLRQPVRVETEHGLNDGGGDAQGGDEPGGRRVAQLVFGNEEGQEGRHGPLVEVREQMAQRCQPDKTGFHRPTPVRRDGLTLPAQSAILLAP